MGTWLSKFKKNNAYFQANGTLGPHVETDPTEKESASKTEEELAMDEKVYSDPTVTSVSEKVDGGTRITDTTTRGWTQSGKDTKNFSKDEDQRNLEKKWIEDNPDEYIKALQDRIKTNKGEDVSEESKFIEDPVEERKVEMYKYRQQGGSNDPNKERGGGIWETIGGATQVSDIPKNSDYTKVYDKEAYGPGSLNRLISKGKKDSRAEILKTKDQFFKDRGGLNDKTRKEWQNTLKDSTKSWKTTKDNYNAFKKGGSKVDSEFNTDRVKSIVERQKNSFENVIANQTGGDGLGVRDAGVSTFGNSRKTKFINYN